MFLEKISDQLNLRWAWEKVKRASVPGDVWIDEIELAGFELGLADNLMSIADEFRTGRYKLSEMRPMAFPKNSDKNNMPKIRQYFHISIRDQVAWMAVVNIIGPHLDYKMPGWSYGNRLYRSIWKEKNSNGKTIRKVGRYRHSSGKIYLPFGQSWPVFRRHVYLTTRAMLKLQNPPQLDEATEQELALEREAREAGQPFCKYLFEDYWTDTFNNSDGEDLYWCSIDLKKFFPSIKLDIVHDTILENLPIEYQKEANKLIHSMLQFQINRKEWDAKSLKAIGLACNIRKFHHLPTGLHVAGFLANVGLLRVDKEVEKLLTPRRIAHFRYVDDHIILAYSFTELVDWVKEYKTLLSKMKVGPQINFEKTEPKELVPLLIERNKNSISQLKIKKNSVAKDACKLDPKFPTPLMTKTLALVSAIARTNFGLLDEGEIEGLTDQLEHMLVSEIPEVEIPEKTRLAFSATKIVQLTECRIANDATLSELGRSREELIHRLKKMESKEKSPDLDKLNTDIQKRKIEISDTVRRAFGLIVKVLHQRPDRVRLWTRAIRMCRQTGVKGISEIIGEIEFVREKNNNPLAAEYLLANLYALLGVEVIVASRIIVDTETPNWQKRAGIEFLIDVCKNHRELGDAGSMGWFVRSSWAQYCVGVYCADKILAMQPTNLFKIIQFPNQLLYLGLNILKDGYSGHPSFCWHWWVTRMFLNSTSPNASLLAIHLGELMQTNQSFEKFWRYFPYDVPDKILIEIMNMTTAQTGTITWDGWWYDALVKKDVEKKKYYLQKSYVGIDRVKNNLTLDTDSGSISLYTWCEELKNISRLDGSDPRIGEWTALEITRQIACLIIGNEYFDRDYIQLLKSGKNKIPCIHPANFRIPKNWIDIEEPTWELWRKTVQGDDGRTKVHRVSEDMILHDSRYTPMLSQDDTLFSSINPVRGIGLILYGLLRKDFALPAIWNGNGQSDVLSYLPKILSSELTCSSWTIGILRSCLQAKAAENLKYSSNNIQNYHFDDDTIHDPIRLISAEDIIEVIKKCQLVLTNNQLSTLNHKARQLTPINLRQMAKTNWTSDFQHVLHNEEGADGDR